MVLAVIFVASAAAAKLSTAREFERLDLFGAWAPNCTGAPTPDNPHVLVARGERGFVLEQDEFGSAYEINRYLIVAARRLKGHELAVDALFQQGDAEPQHQLIVMRVESRTRRTMFTGAGDEPPLVKDGVAVAIGKPTPTLNKCD